MLPNYVILIPVVLTFGGIIWRLWLRKHRLDQVSISVTQRIGSRPDADVAYRSSFDCDLKQLRAYDKFMDDFSLTTIYCTVQALCETRQRRKAFKVISPVHLKAIETVRAANRDMLTLSFGETGRVEIYGYTVNHPEDAEFIAVLLRRGIVQLDQIIEALPTLKVIDSPALMDGAL